MPDDRSIAERSQDRRNERSLRASADHAKQAATSAKDTAKSVDQMVRLSREQLALTKTAREDADRSEKFTRTMAWSSLAVSIASLAAAVVAILVSL